MGPRKTLCPILERTTASAVWSSPRWAVIGRTKLQQWRWLLIGSDSVRPFPGEHSLQGQEFRRACAHPARGRGGSQEWSLHPPRHRHSFHLRASEGFKVKLGSVLFTNASSLIPNFPGNSMLLLQVAVHHHLDQPIMTIKELDVAPGSLVQVAVTPTLTSTSQVPRP